MKFIFRLLIACAIFAFAPSPSVEAQTPRGGPSLEAAIAERQAPVAFTNPANTLQEVDVVEKASDIIPALDTLQPSEILNYVDWLEIALINLLVYLSAFIPGLNQIKTKSRAISIGLLVAYGFFQFKGGFFKAVLSYFGSRKFYDWILVNLIPTDKIPFWLRALFSQPTAPAE
jgi:hypothetical protein